MLIEIFGLPGSGKSTYVRENIKDNEIDILAEKIYSNSRIKRSINKVLPILKLFFIDNKFFRNICKELKKMEFKSLFIKLKMYQLTLSYVSIIKEIKKEKVYYIDEGIVTLIWAIFYNSNKNNFKQIGDFVKIFNLFIGDRLIYVKTDLETIYERLIVRNTSGGSELQKDIRTDKEQLKYANEIMEKILDEITKIKKIEIV